MRRPLALLAACAAMPPIASVPVHRVGVVVPPPAIVSTPHRFGVAIAIEGDRLVVGADGARDGVPDPGVVTVFQRTSAGEWRLEREIQAPRPSPGDRFGASISLDAGRLLVGAPGSADDRGEVWLIDLDASSTEALRYPVPENVRSGDGFGESVAIRGDHLVVGAPRADLGSILDQGRAWCAAAIPSTTGDVTIGPPIELSPPARCTGRRFGSSIAIGVGPDAAIAVGSPGADVESGPRSSGSSVDRAGDVTVFELAPPHRRRSTKHRSQPGPLDRAGTSVAWLGPTLMVGAPRAECGEGRGGVLVLFDRIPRECSRPCRPDGGFGERLAVAGHRFATGVPGRRDDDGRLDAGVVLGDVGDRGARPRLEIVGLGAGVLLEVAMDPTGRHLAIGASRDHEDEGTPGLVWVVTLDSSPPPLAPE